MDRYSSPDIQIDPSAPGTILRVAIASEALINIIGGTAFILYPRSFLSHMVAHPSELASSSRILLQAFGVFTYALTPQLLLALPDTVRGIESRSTVYWSLGAGEVIVMAALVYKALIVERGQWLTPRAVGVSVGLLGAMLVWRLFVLLRKPSWFGRYRAERKID